MRTIHPAYLLSLLLSVGSAPLFGAEPTPTSAPAFTVPPPHSFAVGALRCHILFDTDMDYAANAFFINAPAAQLTAALAPYGGKVTTPYAALLIETGQQRVLIDTGMGPTGNPREGHLLESLKRAGFSPEQIDVVVITHGHLDHIGGLVQPDGKLTYPRARFVIDKREWDFWAADQPNLASVNIPDKARERWIEIAHQQLLPLRDRITLAAPNAEIVPGVRFVDAAGHTPGHSLVRLDSEGKNLLYVSDLVLSPVSLEHPDWYARYEYDVLAAQVSKQRILKQAADEHLHVWAMHFAYPGLGYVVADGDHWKWEVATD
ncbi:MBL fold metallo-hydrolase [Opitutaceae bacterium EW11]|nr:MBL fold metallo-hydrolase [Opitutaceae bacterium EW11]